MKAFVSTIDIRPHVVRCAKAVVVRHLYRHAL